jgi:hypothetical protein
MEVALDLALRCAPDHLWARQHRKWFTELPDGTIAYAENPPKKYQDIYPLNFDNDLLVVVTLNAFAREEAMLWLDLPALGMDF